MATTSEITKDIKETYGSSLLNQRQAGDYLGMKKDKRMSFLADLPCYKTGKEKKYHAIDLAKKINSIKTFYPYG